VEEEPNLFVKEGVGTLIKTHGEKLETLFPNQFKKSLSTPVTSIRWRPGSVEVRATGHPMESGDACLVTVPPPVLRNRDITFKPDLPFQHREAIGFLKLGSYKKIALVLTKVPNDIAMETYYLRIQQNPNGVWVYYRSPFSPNVLVAHAAGEFAAALDHKRNDVVVKMLKTTLRACYGGIVFAETSAVTNWNADKFARGAYSYTAPKTDFDRWPGRVFDSDASFNGLNDDERESIEEDVTAFEARVRFREPVGQTLWFAGEATDTDFYGTIAGAYNEGVRAATEILNGASVSNKKK
jgi:monoamine oxidase